MNYVEPIYREDYQVHWGFTDYHSRRVLDLGADEGSTAYWFLEQGASFVCAVEKNPEYLASLRKNTAMDDRVYVPINMKGIESSDDIESLIFAWKPHIVKMDIEGDERFLPGVDRNIAGLPADYLIETHTAKIHAAVNAFLVSLGYHTMIPYHIPIPEHEVIHAWRPAP